MGQFKSFTCTWKELKTMRDVTTNEMTQYGNDLSLPYCVISFVGCSDSRRKLMDDGLQCKKYRENETFYLFVHLLIYIYIYIYIPIYTTPISISLILYILICMPVCLSISNLSLFTSIYLFKSYLSFSSLPFRLIYIFFFSRFVQIYLSGCRFIYLPFQYLSIYLSIYQIKSHLSLYLSHSLRIDLSGCRFIYVPF